MNDVFRKEYKPVSELTKIWIMSLKDNAQKLHDYFESCSCEHDKRMMALAKTNLEQAVMWAVKSIT